MAELLGFADGELRNAGGAEIFVHRPVDLGRIDEIELRRVEVAVILHHAGVHDVGTDAAVELGELFGLERLRDLKRTVAAEVEEDDRIVIFHRADRSPAVVGDDEGRQVLVDRAGFFAQGFDRFVGVPEHFAAPWT